MEVISADILPSSRDAQSATTTPATPPADYQTGILLPPSLKTTNGLESINALIEERCAKVDHWQHSSQRHRWLATALLDIEPRLRKVMGYRHLPRPQGAKRSQGARRPRD